MMICMFQRRKQNHYKFMTHQDWKAEQMLCDLLGVAINWPDGCQQQTLLSAVVLRDAPHHLHQLCCEPVRICWGSRCQLLYRKGNIHEQVLRHAQACLELAAQLSKGFGVLCHESVCICWGCSCQLLHIRHCMQQQILYL